MKSLIHGNKKEIKEEGVQNMFDIVLKPELRTAGGEATSIYNGDQWIGDMYLVYREHDMLTGTVNIDAKTVSAGKVRKIKEKVNQYVRHLGASLKVTEEDVSLIYGEYFNGSPMTANFSVLVSGEDRQGIHYVIKNQNGSQVATALVNIVSTDLIGKIEFVHDPAVKQVDEVVQMILDQYDEQLLDTVQFDVQTSDTPPDEDMPEEWVNPELPNEFLMNENRSESNDLHLAMVGEVKDSTFYDVMNEYEDTVAEVIFDQEEEGVEVSINFLIPPDPKLKKSIVRQLTREALAQDHEWINMRMHYHGDAVGGFHIERG
jgi:hypothetical protein